MKSRAELVKGLLAKAESDLAAAQACLAKGTAFDAVCFHAQQAAEKFVKAYLAAKGVEYPFIHNLEKLIGLCVNCDAAFASLLDIGAQLTPFAVDLRYDAAFWPTEPVSSEALQSAIAIRDFVVARLPHEYRV